jgi:hypothetical protein
LFSQFRVFLSLQDFAFGDGDEIAFSVQ